MESYAKSNSNKKLYSSYSFRSRQDNYFCTTLRDVVQIAAISKHPSRRSIFKEGPWSTLTVVTATLIVYSKGSSTLDNVNYEFDFTGRHINELSRRGIALITITLNAVLRTCYFSPQCKTTKIILIHKLGKPSNNIY